MTTKYPVDSTTCQECQAIGTHLRTCSESPTSEPCGSVKAHGPHAVIVVNESDPGLSYCPGHAAELLRPAYGCPDWCVRNDHDADYVGPGHPPVHYAPAVGAVSLQSDGFTTEVIVYLGDGSAFVSDPAELRRVAADMLKGAEWLEAHA